MKQIAETTKLTPELAPNLAPGLTPVALYCRVLFYRLPPHSKFPQFSSPSCDVFPLLHHHRSVAFVVFVCLPFSTELRSVQYSCFSFGNRAIYYT